MALFFVRIRERVSADPQEARAMARIRADSLDWLERQISAQAILLAFRDASNVCTYSLVDAADHRALHRAIDPDPLLSYSDVTIEPILRPAEMVAELADFLGDGRSALTQSDWALLEDHGRQTVDPGGVYYFAEKVVRPFSPLLPVEEQALIHRNTLISQRAHADAREVLDVNPVGRPVGLLIMKAANEAEVRKHVEACEVYVDTTVTYMRLLTLSQARDHNDAFLNLMHRGCMRDR